MFEIKLLTNHLKNSKNEEKWFKIAGLVFKAGLPTFSCTKS
jgi:hypothetical protein